jgi:hypothetical protein
VNFVNFVNFEAETETNTHRHNQGDGIIFVIDERKEGHRKKERKKERHLVSTGALQTTKNQTYKEDKRA